MADNSTPRLIGYWHDPDLPEDIARIQQSWRAVWPGEIVIYDRAAARDFIDRTYGARELAAFDSCAIPAMQADLFRILEILRHGGFYLDMGIELREPLPGTLKPNGLVLYRRWHGRIVNCLFAAPPGHPLLADILAAVLDNIEARESNNVWLVTGPGAWIPVTDNGYRESITVHDHAAIAGRFFAFHQQLAHKQQGRHWSERQKEISIYA